MSITKDTIFIAFVMHRKYYKPYTSVINSLIIIKTKTTLLYSYVQILLFWIPNACCFNILLFPWLMIFKIFSLTRRNLTPVWIHIGAYVNISSKNLPPKRQGKLSPSKDKYRVWINVNVLNHEKKWPDRSLKDCRRSKNFYIPWRKNHVPLLEKKP